MAKNDETSIFNYDELLVFLKLTKEGKYTEITKEELQYQRIAEIRDDSCEEQYFYSLS